MKKVLVLIVIAVLFFSSKVLADGLWLWGFPTGVTGDMSTRNYQIEAGKDLILEGYSVSAKGQTGTKGCLWIYRGPQTLDWSIANGVPWIVDSSKGQAFFNERLQHMISNNQARADIRPLPEWDNPPTTTFVEKTIYPGDCTTGYIELYDYNTNTWTPQVGDYQGLLFINCTFNTTVKIRYRTGTGNSFDVFSYYAKPTNYQKILEDYACQLHTSTGNIKIIAY